MLKVVFGTKSTKQPNAFDIFDTDKTEIIWDETTKDDLGYFYNPPQANDKFGAILDDKYNPPRRTRKLQE